MLAREQAHSAPQATLELASPVIASGEGLSYSVVNAGSARLLVDSACGIEWATGSGWVALPITVPPAAAVTVLQPHSRSEPELCSVAKPLLSGRYRLTKQVIGVDRSQSDSLLIRHEFSVQRPEGDDW